RRDLRAAGTGGHGRGRADQDARRQPSARSGPGFARPAGAALMPGLSARLTELGLELQPTTAPMGNYLPAVVEGNLIFCAGATCMQDGKPLFRGKFGRELTAQQGATAARVAVLNA